MDTVKIKSNAHPSGYIIVNADDLRAKVKQEQEPKPKRKYKKRNG